MTVFVGFIESGLETTGAAASCDSSPWVQRLFCPQCGTPIGYRDAGLPDEIYFYVGVFEEPMSFQPSLHAFYSECLPWLSIRDELPVHERFSRPRRRS